jgi:hypothetical protein
VLAGGVVASGGFACGVVCAGAAEGALAGVVCGVDCPHIAVAIANANPATIPAFGLLNGAVMTSPLDLTCDLRDPRFCCRAMQLRTKCAFASTIRR